MTHGPWTGWTYGGSSFVADGAGRILLTARDRDTDRRLEQSGWLVVRVWEHQSVAQAADAVELALEHRRSGEA